MVSKRPANSPAKQQHEPKRWGKLAAVPEDAALQAEDNPDISADNFSATTRSGKTSTSRTMLRAVGRKWMTRTMASPCRKSNLCAARKALRRILRETVQREQHMVSWQLSCRRRMLSTELVQQASQGSQLWISLRSKRRRFKPRCRRRGGSARWFRARPVQRTNGNRLTSQFHPPTSSPHRRGCT